jgi:hypothetical protein
MNVKSTKPSRVEHAGISFEYDMIWTTWFLAILEVLNSINAENMQSWYFEISNLGENKMKVEIFVAM